MVISQDEWKEHFRLDLWRRFAQAKKKFDPNHVLSPELATFWEYNRAAA